MPGLRKAINQTPPGVIVFCERPETGNKDKSPESSPGACFSLNEEACAPRNTEASVFAKKAPAPYNKISRLKKID
jgi:hypothetical protein